MAAEEETTAAELQRLLEVQKAALRERGAPSVRERERRLDVMIRLLLASEDDLVAAVTADFGVRPREVTRFADVLMALEAFKAARAGVRSWCRPERRRVDFPFNVVGATNYVEYQPKGVVGVVALSGLFDLTASTGSYDRRVDPLFSDAPDEERRSTIRDGLAYLGREPRDKDVNSVLTAAWCCYPPKLTKLLRDWRCSPLFAPTDLLKKLPSTLLVVGAHEVLLDESLQLGGSIKDCRVVVFEDMWHDFFLYSEGRTPGNKLDEAQHCIDLVSKFVKDTSAAAAPTKEALPEPVVVDDGGVFLTGVVDSPDKVLSPGREQTPEDVMVARRKAALLPRCYVAYASSSDGRMTASNWTTLLTVSGVFEAERVKVLKADLIYSVLSRDGALGYRAFRQALRQVAVTLYPELGEGDAFRRLVEEDVLPRATLAPVAAAMDPKRPFRT